MSTQGVGFVMITPRKAVFGKPCTGCGMCCQSEACSLSREYLNSSVAPCIALEWTGERFRCGLLVRPTHYLTAVDDDYPHSGEKAWADPVLIPLFRKALGAGEGCDCDWSEAVR